MNENYYEWKGNKIKFKKEHYSSNFSSAILISMYNEKDKYWEDYGKLTTNVDAQNLKSNEVTVKLWSENEPYKDFLKVFPDLFKDTGKRILSGFVEVHIWEVDPVIFSNN